MFICKYVILTTMVVYEYYFKIRHDRKIVINLIINLFKTFIWKLLDVSNRRK